MCGIVAIIAKEKGKFSYKLSKVFKAMLYVDALRGDDSTGVFSVNKYGNVEWCKEASTPENFLANKEASRLISNIAWDSRAVVGHNRSATRGSVTDENAHPFTEGSTILVHNGTLINHRSLNASVEVDSHAMTHAIEEFGIRDAIPKINGAFAIIGYNIVKQQMFVVRNKERPLWVCETDDVWVLSSEPWIAFGACWREGIKLDKMRELTPATLLTFDMTEDETKLTSEEVQLYVEPPKHVPTVIKTFPTKVAPTKGKPKSGFDKYEKASVVNFKPLQIEDSASSWRIIGETRDGYRVSAWVPKKDYSQIEMEVISQQDMVVGEVLNTYFDQKLNTGTVYVRDCSVAVPYYSVNGVELWEEDMALLPGICTTCKGEIDDDDVESSYVKFNRNRTIHICPTCVGINLDKNPKWGGIEAYEASRSAVV